MLGTIIGVFVGLYVGIIVMRRKFGCEKIKESLGMLFCKE